MEGLVALLNGLKETIDSLQAKLVDAQASLDEAVKKAYDEGFAAGVASVPVNDKVYSQAEVDAKIAEAVQALNEKVLMLEDQVKMLQEGQDKAVAEALAAFKADLKAKYEEQQVAETASETGFAEFLK